jgi:hypothetical protein
MYDKGKIITGVVIGLLLLTFPMAYLAASGEGGDFPEPVLPLDEDQCVEPAEWMSDNHMRLLDEWRNTVVRGGDRTYVAGDRLEYYIGLTGLDEEEMSRVRDSLEIPDLKSGGCLQCHSNKDEFCDTCHSYAGVEPECWNCHVEGDE